MLGFLYGALNGLFVYILSGRKQRALGTSLATAECLAPLFDSEQRRRGTQALRLVGARAEGHQKDSTRSLARLALR